MAQSVVVPGATARALSGDGQTIVFTTVTPLDSADDDSLSDVYSIKIATSQTTLLTVGQSGASFTRVGGVNLDGAVVAVDGGTDPANTMAFRADGLTTVELGLLDRH